MRKNLHLYILITVICISISGCGKTGADNSNTYNLTEETPDLSSPDNIQNHDSQTEKPVDKEEDNSAPASTPEITSMSSAKPGIKKEIISAGKDYSDANRLVTFLGLKEYKKIKGETFTDKPKKGNKYLVLFLSIKNNDLKLFNSLSFFSHIQCVIVTIIKVCNIVKNILSHSIPSDIPQIIKTLNINTNIVKPIINIFHHFSFDNTVSFCCSTSNALFNNAMIINKPIKYKAYAKIFVNITTSTFSINF